MVWIVIYSGGIRKFYSFDKMAEFMQVPADVLYQHKDDDSFRIDEYTVKKEKSSTLLGRFAYLRKELADEI